MINIFSIQKIKAAIYKVMNFENFLDVPLQVFNISEHEARTIYAKNNALEPNGVLRRTEALKVNYLPFN